MHRLLKKSPSLKAHLTTAVEEEYPSARQRATIQTGLPRATFPELSPPFVVAASYILLFGPRGVISYRLLGQSPNVLGLGGLWGVQTIAFFPFAYQLIADVLSRSDPSLEQAARNLGAGAWEVFRTVTWNIPIGYQAAIVGLQQIDRSIDEAAISLGASSLRSFRDILFPMLHSALLVGIVTTFVRAVTTLSVVIFLFTPGTTVATITIFQLINDFNWGGATAFTVAVIGMAVAVLVVIWVISGRRATVQNMASGSTVEVAGWLAAMWLPRLWRLSIGSCRQRICGSTLWSGASMP
jgi:ABC-type Fe3+ transport system permease subunit